jgi:hypothetical protein
MLEVCDVNASDAALVAEDISLRAEAAARIDAADLETMAAPFYEESFTHDPDDAPPWLKAITTLVIRNSQLEEMHANGPVDDGLITITTYGAGPLSHLISAQRRSPLPTDVTGDPFAGLPDEYPRAWACLKMLRTCLNTGGGRIDYRPPRGPVPVLPDASEVVEEEPADNVETPSAEFTAVVFSAIDPRFDQHAFHMLERAVEHEGLIVGLSALSRLSRNSGKLHRVLEFLLAHQARVLTTNYLLTDKEVWARRGDLVKPDSEHMMKGLEDLRGLSGAHRKTIESWLQQVADSEAAES